MKKFLQGLTLLFIFIGSGVEVALAGLTSDIARPKTLVYSGYVTGLSTSAGSGVCSECPDGWTLGGSSGFYQVIHNLNLPSGHDLQCVVQPFIFAAMMSTTYAYTNNAFNFAVFDPATKAPDSLASVTSVNFICHLSVVTNE